MNKKVKEFLDNSSNYEVVEYIGNLQERIDRLDKVNCKLRRKIGQLEDNWEKLKDYIKTEIPEDVFINTEWFVSILDKMQEIEGSGK